MACYIEGMWHSEGCGWGACAAEGSTSYCTCGCTQDRGVGPASAVYAGQLQHTHNTCQTNRQDLFFFFFFFLFLFFFSTKPPNSKRNFFSIVSLTSYSNANTQNPCFFFFFFFFFFDSKFKKNYFAICKTHHRTATTSENYETLVALPLSFLLPGRQSFFFFSTFVVASIHSLEHSYNFELMTLVERKGRDVRVWCCGQINVFYLISNYRKGRAGGVAWRREELSRQTTCVFSSAFFNCQETKRGRDGGRCDIDRS